MNIKESKVEEFDWKKKSLVWRGGVIGAGFGILIILFNFIIIPLNFAFLSKIVGFFMIPSVLLTFFVFRDCTNNLGCLVYYIWGIYIFTTLFYGLLGLLIGFIIKMIKEKKRKR